MTRCSFLRNSMFPAVTLSASCSSADWAAALPPVWWKCHTPLTVNHMFVSRWQLLLTLPVVAGCMKHFYFNALNSRFSHLILSNWHVHTYVQSVCSSNKAAQHTSTVSLLTLGYFISTSNCKVYNQLLISLSGGLFELQRTMTSFRANDFTWFFICTIKWCESKRSKLMILAYKGYQGQFLWGKGIKKKSLLLLRFRYLANAYLFCYWEKLRKKKWTDLLMPFETHSFSCAAKQKDPMQSHSTRANTGSGFTWWVQEAAGVWNPASGLSMSLAACQQNRWPERKHFCCAASVRGVTFNTTNTM